MFCGIDLGGTNTVAGLVSEDGKLIESVSEKTKSFKSAEDMVKVMSKHIKEMTEKNRQPLMGIGIGAPCANYNDGTMVNPMNLFAIKGIIPLVALFKDEFPKTPVYLTNDANAAAIGEKIYGAGKELRDFVVITLGTGLGSGFIVNGELVHGANGMAGEMGHVIIEENGRQCNCGRKGCLERYAAAEGIMQTYAEICKKKNQEVKCSEVKEVSDLAAKGDECALETYKYAGEILGAALANMALVTAPSHIILFGGIMNAGDLLLNPIRESFERHLLDTFRNSIIIQRSALPEENIAVLGAAALAQHHVFKNKITF
ncbi:MAG: ROK family protein [Bacteroidales bacterium]|jgi:glucokinase|nr:ROK family protein [Bacteroidales bacterium]